MVGQLQCLPPAENLLALGQCLPWFKRDTGKFTHIAGVVTTKADEGKREALIRSLGGAKSTTDQQTRCEKSRTKKDTKRTGRFLTPQGTDHQSSSRCLWPLRHHIDFNQRFTG